MAPDREPVSATQLLPAVGDDIMVWGGYAQWKHGSVTLVDAHSFTEPFLTFLERGSRGRLCVTRPHLVPVRLCAAFALPRPRPRKGARERT